MFLVSQVVVLHCGVWHSSFRFLPSHREGEIGSSKMMILQGGPFRKTILDYNNLKDAFKNIYISKDVFCEMLLKKASVGLKPGRSLSKVDSSLRNNFDAFSQYHRLSYMSLETGIYQLNFL